MASFFRANSLRASSLELLEKYRNDLPEHEIEMLLESAYVSEFPSQPRPTRADLHGLGRDLAVGRWALQAETWIEQRIRNQTPVQHLTRESHFYGRSFEVGPEALIPRPETEILVHEVLRELKTGDDRTLRGAEVGLGSGVISLTLLAELGPKLQMVATEVEEGASELAKRNAQRLGVSSRLEGVLVADSPRARAQAQVLEPLVGYGPFDFLVSNPPYLVAGSDEAQVEVVRSEPHRALFAPPGDPLYFYREIASGAVNLLRPKGMIALEIPHERSQEIEQLFRAERVTIRQDLSGRDRVLVAFLK